MQALKGKNGLQSWCVVLIAALFFFYEFIQMNMFNAINHDLRVALSIDPSGIGLLSSMYFIANVIFLFPAGIIIDRMSTRKVILVSMLICVLGTALFAGTSSYAWAIVFRFLTGIGSAFCFISVVRLASRWFSADKMALVVGVVVTLAMLGGVIANTPLVMLSQAIGWRTALYWDAGLGALLFFAILIGVKDYPASQAREQEQQQAALQQLGYVKSMSMAFSKHQNWLAALYTSLMNLPLGVLGGLWGVPYVAKHFHYDSTHASVIVSMLFMGTIVGSPLVGALSDRMRDRRWLMMIGAGLSLIIFYYIYFHPLVPEWMAMIVFFLLGLITSTQIISYALVSEINSPLITAMAVSVISILTQGGMALYQQIFSYFIRDHMMFRLHHVALAYTDSDFSWAILMVPAGFVIAFVLAYFIRKPGERVSNTEGQ